MRFCVWCFVVFVVYGWAVADSLYLACGFVVCLLFTFGLLFGVCYLVYLCVCLSVCCLVLLMLFCLLFVNYDYLCFAILLGVCVFYDCSFVICGWLLLLFGLLLICLYSACFDVFCL